MSQLSEDGPRYSTVVVDSSVFGDGSDVRKDISNKMLGHIFRNANKEGNWPSFQAEVFRISSADGSLLEDYFMAEGFGIELAHPAKMIRAVREYIPDLYLTQEDLLQIVDRTIQDHFFSLAGNNKEFFRFLRRTKGLDLLMIGDYLEEVLLPILDHTGYLDYFGTIKLNRLLVSNDGTIDVDMKYNSENLGHELGYHLEENGIDRKTVLYLGDNDRCSQVCGATFHYAESVAENLERLTQKAKENTNPNRLLHKAERMVYAAVEKKLGVGGWDAFMADQRNQLNPHSLLRLFLYSRFDEEMVPEYYTYPNQQFTY